MTAVNLLPPIAELRPSGTATRVDAPVIARGWAAAAAVCGVVYSLLGIWTIRSANYMIGDAAYRVSNARVILFSRDPHLAAIGMTWMPLATLSTLPFTAVLEPFGLGWAAGSIMTGCYGGGTVWMLIKLAHHVDASKIMTALVVCLFALNPVVIFWNGSAMMEGPSVFFLTWACVAWIRWVERRAIVDLAIVGVALGFGVMTRYEQVVATAAFCGLVWFAARTEQRLSSVMMVGLPSAAVVIVWLSVNFIIRGSFFAFVGAPPVGGSCGGFLPISLRDPAKNIYDWCQIDMSMWDGVSFGAERFLRFAPALVLPVPLLLAVDIRRRWRYSVVLAVLCAGLAGPAFASWLTHQGRTSGNPRYFYTAILIPPILALWAGGRTSTVKGRLWAPAMTVMLALGVVTSVRLELNQLYTGVEGEESAISRLTGLDPERLDGDTSPRGTGVDQWREAAARVDSITDEDDLIAIDTSAGFPILLFSDHLDRFAIPEDRDFEQLLSLTESRFTYVVVRGSSSATGVDQKLGSLVTTAGGSFTWEQVDDLAGFGQLWQRIDPTNTSP